MKKAKEVKKPAPKKTAVKKVKVAKPGKADSSLVGGRPDDRHP